MRQKKDETKRVAGEVLLADVLQQYMRSNGVRPNSKVALIAEAWDGVVGPEIALHTLVKGYRRGVLCIEVDSAPWLQELASFRRQEILERLSTSLPEAKVHDLRFNIRG